MRTDPLKAQVVAHDTELLLHGPLSDGKNQIVTADIVAQAIILNVLLDHQWDGKHTTLAGFLLNDLQTVPIPVPDDIPGAKLQYIACLLYTSC